MPENSIRLIFSILISTNGWWFLEKERENKNKISFLDNIFYSEWCIDNATVDYYSVMESCALQVYLIYGTHIKGCLRVEYDDNVFINLPYAEYSNWHHSTVILKWWLAGDLYLVRLLVSIYTLCDTHCLYVQSCSRSPWWRLHQYFCIFQTFFIQTICSLSPSSK